MGLVKIIIFCCLNTFSVLIFSQTNPSPKNFYKLVIKEDSLRQKCSEEFWFDKTGSKIRVDIYSESYSDMTIPKHTYSSNSEKVKTDTNLSNANCIKEVYYNSKRDLTYKTTTSHYDLKAKVEGTDILLSKDFSYFDKGGLTAFKTTKWNKKGVKIYEYTEQKNNIQCIKKWNNEGNLILKVRELSDCKEGASQEHGCFEGWQKSWYDNGQLQYKFLFKNGYIAKYYEWTESGTLVLVKNYKADSKTTMSKLLNKKKRRLFWQEGRCPCFSVSVQMFEQVK